MRLHELNCGTLRPPGGTMVCRVLLLEVGARLVLVDAGFGRADVADPRRLGPVRWLLGAALDEAETAHAQITKLGLDPSAVSDVVLTHGDLDHAGGISDFPQARIHLLAAEHAAIRAPHGLVERLRYRPEHWAHDPLLVLHRPGREGLLGLPGAADLSEVAPGMHLVPLPGHTAGHAGVAIPDPAGGWLLHVGDAAHSARTLSPTTARTGAGGGPLGATVGPFASVAGLLRDAGIAARQAVLAQDVALLRSTQRRLLALRSRESSVRLVTSHDAAVERPGDPAPRIDHAAPRRLKL
jgi:glyoxylase-like metal-dependent hydrolase (beta-lactamase superfamily II)